MSRLPQVEREVLDLVWAMASDRLDADGAARLERLVVEDRSARTAFLAASDLLAGLEWGEVEARGLPAQYTGDAGGAELALAEIQSVAEVFGVEVRQPAQTGGWRRVPLWLAKSPARAIVAVACIYYAIAAGLFYSISFRPQSELEGQGGVLAQVELPTPTVPKTEPTEPTVAPYKARLTGGRNIRWRYPNVPVAIGSELPSGELELVQGVAEVTFGDGAQVSLKAPAELTVVSAGSARLHLGRLSAHVPPQAVGFRVQTPTTDVVDLGTDFSVEVSKSNETQVWVHNGLVELHSRIELPGEAVGRRKQLRGGEYLRVASLAGKSTAAENSTGGDQFVRHAPLRRDPMLVEQGGSFAPNNLSLLPTAQPFATKCLEHPGHSIAGLCDGRYGNSSSWIAEPAGQMFAGVRFGGKQTISSIAFGRDNGNDLPEEPAEALIDRCAGTYTVQVTTAESPDAYTPESDWTTLGMISQGGVEVEIASGLYKPHLRHRYAFKPIEATGVRILVSDAGIAIDELEVYPLLEAAGETPAL